MTADAPFLPGLPTVAGKKVHVAFDGGRMSSDAGVLVSAEIGRRLGIADRLARRHRDRPGTVPVIEPFHQPSTPSSKS